MLAGQDADDVGDARRAPELVPPRVGLLHAHLEADLLQLIDDVVARARVGRGADRPAADRAREHADVRARVGVDEKAGLPGTGGQHRAPERSKRGMLSTANGNAPRQTYPTGSPAYRDRRRRRLG